MMNSSIHKDQWKRFADFLSHQRTCIISTIAAQGMWAMPVWYRPDTEPTGNPNLELDCLVPHWTDVAHYLTEDRRVVLIVQAPSGVGLRWLQIQATARQVEAPDWKKLLPRWVSTTQPDALYMVVRVRPSRIDLIDEELGWGVQETLELIR
jgi:hypothetical protein